MTICEAHHTNPMVVEYITALFYDIGKKKWSAQIGISCPVCHAPLAFLDTNMIDCPGGKITLPITMTLTDPEPE